MTHEERSFDFSRAFEEAAPESAKALMAERHNASKGTEGEDGHDRRTEPDTGSEDMQNGEAPTTAMQKDIRPQDSPDRLFAATAEPIHAYTSAEPKQSEIEPGITPSASSANPKFQSTAEENGPTAPGIPTRAAKVHHTVASTIVNAAAYRTDAALNPDLNTTELHSTARQTSHESTAFANDPPMQFLSSKLNADSLGRSLTAEAQGLMTTPSGETRTGISLERSIAGSSLHSDSAAATAISMQSLAKIEGVLVNPGSADDSGQPVKLISAQPLHPEETAAKYAQSEDKNNTNQSVQTQTTVTARQMPTPREYAATQKPYDVGTASAQPVQIHPGKMAATPVQPTGVQTISNMKWEPAAAGSQDTAQEFLWDLRLQTTPVQQPHASSLHRQELPGHITQQLAQAIHRSPDRAVERYCNLTSGNLVGDCAESPCRGVPRQR
uniref:hypothetical protein n=1 Tax=Tateyamaria pelophila TaxID=328415 RepID=UPI001CBD57D3